MHLLQERPFNHRTVEAAATTVQDLHELLHLDQTVLAVILQALVDRVVCHLWLAAHAVFIVLD